MKVEEHLQNDLFVKFMPLNVVCMSVTIALPMSTAIYI